MPVVVVGAAAGAAAGAGGGAAAGAGASAGAAAGAGGGAATGAGASTAAGAGTGGAEAGAGNLGKTGTGGVPGGSSNSMLGTKLKSNFGANAGDGLKAGAKSVDGSVPGQDMSVSKSDTKAYDRYKDRAKDIKDNVDRARDVKDTLFSDEDEEDNADYVPDAEALRKAGKSKGAAGKVGKLAAIIVVLFVFLLCAPAAFISAPISVAKGIGETLFGSSEFAALAPGGVPGIGTTVSAAKYFSLLYKLVSRLEDKDFLKTSMSKEMLLELIYLSESSYDNSIYQFNVEFLKEYETGYVKVGEKPVYGEVIVDENGAPVLDEDGNEVREIIGYEDVLEEIKEPVYEKVLCSLDMKNYIAEYYVPWELPYAIAVASDLLGNGNLEPGSLSEDVLESGLIYDITDKLEADIRYLTDYRRVYYNKVAEVYHGAGLTGLSVVAPLSYEELRGMSHRVIEDVEEGYLPHVVVVEVSSYLYDYTFYWGFKDGGHYSELVSKTLNPEKLKEVVAEQRLSRTGKIYMVEILLELNREDLARAVDQVFELKYNFNKGK